MAAAAAEPQPVVRGWAEAAALDQEGRPAGWVEGTDQEGWPVELRAVRVAAPVAEGVEVTRAAPAAGVVAAREEQVEGE